MIQMHVVAEGALCLAVGDGPTLAHHLAHSAALAPLIAADAHEDDRRERQESTDGPGDDLSRVA